MSDSTNPSNRTDGSWPVGRSHDEERELAITVANSDGKVIMSFGKPIAWIAMDPQNAADLASYLIGNACDSGDVVGVEVKLQLG